VSDATTLGSPSGALGLGLGHGEAAVCSDHVHGGVAAHRAWWWCHRFDEIAVKGRSLSLGMVLRLMAMWQHALEGDDGV